MKFIDKGQTVKVQIAAKNIVVGWQILAEFNIVKPDFKEFLDHVIDECKKAYKREELFR